MTLPVQSKILITLKVAAIIQANVKQQNENATILSQELIIHFPV